MGVLEETPTAIPKFCRHWDIFLQEQRAAAPSRNRPCSLPHIPDAIYYYDFDENKKASATNKEKLGAEIPFTRYFYHYEAPKGSFISRRIYS